MQNFFQFPANTGPTRRIVRELQKRLIAEGFLTDDVVESGYFCRQTGDALIAFQTQQGLPPDGSCDQYTWAALVEAAWNLGSRLLYFTSPQLRGNDVAVLQDLLAKLGFDCGRIDGILGPKSIRALIDFQTNFGLAPDGICGPETLRALDRVIGHGGDGPGIVTVREYEELLRGDFFGASASPRIVIATMRNQSPQLIQIAQQISRELHDKSEQVIIIDHADVNDHIRTANAFEAHVYLGIDYAIADENVVAYYETPTFVSQGGRSLAQEVVAQLSETRDNVARVVGMRLPVLRETRMPAVICTFDKTPMFEDDQKTYAHALANAVSTWVSRISEGSPPASSD